MAVDTSPTTARNVIRVTFSEDRNVGWQLDLDQISEGFDALAEFLDDCYVIMTPRAFLASLLRKGAPRGSKLSSGDRIYLDALRQLRHDRHLDEDLGRIIKWQLRWRQLPLSRRRRRGPYLALVDIKPGSVQVVLDVAEWAAGGGMAGLFAALYLAQTHRARVRKAKATLDADTAEARLRMRQAQTESLELIGRRFERRLGRAGLGAEFEIPGDEDQDDE